MIGIQHAYKRLLGRDADPSGLNFYTRMIEKGKTLEYVESNIRMSDEYKSKPLINVFMLARDNSGSLPQTLNGLRDIELSFSQFNFAYYILENDSTDETPILLRVFYTKEHTAGRLCCEINKANKWGAVRDFGRVSDMANYRNQCKAMCRNWDNSEFSLLIDTGVTFTLKTFKTLIDTLHNDKDIAMATPYGHLKNNPGHYYDTYAWSCNKHKTPPKQRSMMQSMISVDSAFAGFVLVRTKALRASSWKATNKECSEHNYFCQHVRKFGKIVMCRDANVYWSQKD